MYIFIFKKYFHILFFFFILSLNPSWRMCVCARTCMHLCKVSQGFFFCFIWVIIFIALFIEWSLYFLLVCNFNIISCLCIPVSLFISGSLIVQLVYLFIPMTRWFCLIILILSWALIFSRDTLYQSKLIFLQNCLGYIWLLLF